MRPAHDGQIASFVTATGDTPQPLEIEAATSWSSIADVGRSSPAGFSTSRSDRRVRRAPTRISSTCCAFPWSTLRGPPLPSVDTIIPAETRPAAVRPHRRSWPKRRPHRIERGPDGAGHRSPCAICPSNSHLRIGALYRPNLAACRTGTRSSPIGTGSLVVAHVRLRPGADPRGLEGRMQPALKRLVPTNIRDTLAGDGLGFTQALMNIREINTGAYRFRDDARGNADQDARHLRHRRGLPARRRLRQLHQPRDGAAPAGAREVALRKTLGATPGQLIRQFLFEPLCSSASPNSPWRWSSWPCPCSTTSSMGR